MEIKKIHTQEIDLAKLQGGKLQGLSTNAKDEVSPQDSVELDTISVENFQNLKNFVANAAQPGRADYVQKIKNAVLAGEYNLDSRDLADSMIDDGFFEEFM